jgi:hypothetical protein
MRRLPPALAVLGFVAAAPWSLAENPAEEAAKRDRERLASLETFVKEIDTPRNSYSEGGLTVKASIAPSALAYRAAKEYLAARRPGRSHDDALADLQKMAAGWKPLKGRFLLRLTLENPKYEVGEKSVRIFTFDEKLPGRVLQLTPAGKRPVTLSALGAPAQLRYGEVRIKKFWKLAKGPRKRVIEPDPDDPVPAGFEPKLSEPMAVWILEKRPASAEFTFSAKGLEKTAAFDLRLSELKKYEGPFKKNQIDLNAHRRWEPIAPLGLKVELPPEGTTLPEAIETLLDEIHVP